MQVPRQLGEVAAFGGSNVEPSVRSCFEKVIVRYTFVSKHVEIKNVENGYLMLELVRNKLAVLVL